MRHNEYHVIPEKEKQCVWMTSGLITYKLCARDYHCEECVFDQVMRDETAVAPGQRCRKDCSILSASAAEMPLQLKSSLFYHQGHCWVKVEEPAAVRIGIDGILAGFVARIRTVTLPRAGEALVAGQCFAHIIQERHIVPLVAPLSGTVLSVNEELLQKPGLLTGDAWERGWLLKVKPANLEQDLRSLLCGSRAIAWYRQREQEITEARTALCSRPELGPTMQDGGEPVAHPTDALSSEQYYQILESLSRIEEL